MNDEQRPPSWLIAKIDQRVARIEEAAGEGINAFSLGGLEPLVVTPLTEPQDWGLTMDEWERSCDNCGVVTPEGREFYTGNMIRKLKHGQLISITFGTCRACRDLV